MISRLGISKFCLMFSFICWEASDNVLVICKLMCSKFVKCSLLFFTYIFFLISGTSKMAFLSAIECKLDKD